MRLNTNGVAPSGQLVELPVELAFEFQRHFRISESKMKPKWIPDDHLECSTASINSRQRFGHSKVKIPWNYEPTLGRFGARFDT